MKIGVIGKVINDVFGINTNYMEFANEFGTPILVSPIEHKDFEKYSLDALLLPGGADIDEIRYSSFPSFFVSKPDIFLEYFDAEILPKVLGSIPIFGICRGLQTLNVVNGGTLIKHLYFHPYSKTEDDIAHEISFGNGIKTGVNSFHHQAIRKLGQDFEIVAESDDGIVEAIISKKRKAAGVQWHPERLHDIYSKELFEEIL